MMAAERFKGRNSLRVLVCDDDPALLDLMARRLEKLGLTVEKAGAGAEASMRLSQHDYDLLVTDIYMPEITGLELLRQFKAKDPKGQVVVATASATLESAVEALNDGAFAYLTKPFDHISVFDNVVSRAIDFRRLMLDNQRMADVQRRRGDLLEEEVTSRIQKLKGQHQYLTALMASLPVGIVVCDDKGRVVLTNPVAERILGTELADPSALFQRLTKALPVQDGRVRGEAVFPGGKVQATLVDLPLGDRQQRILVLAETDEAIVSQGTILVQAMAQLRKGMTWLTRQPLEGDIGKMARAVLQQLREVERLAGVTADEVEPTPTPPAVEERPPAPERQLLERGRAYLGQRSPRSEAVTKPTAPLVARPEDLKRSVQRWAQTGELSPIEKRAGDGEIDDNGHGSATTESSSRRDAWPPPLPTKAQS
jgi:CheY-like chemotaxis protein